ncbi:MAG: hypothetical protein CL663_03390 [Bacteroidetes bacterium]|nr:hypothetical protein [Bacteroidota bacterium]
MKPEDKKILDHASRLKLKGNKSKAEIWSELEQKIEPRKRKLNPIVYYAAAAITILIGLAIVYPYSTDHSTQFSEAKKISFRDGSFVELSAGSELIQKRGWWTKKKSFLLEGEAFFNITKGSDVEVIGEQGKVSVLGTEFNVLSRDKNMIVECYEGKVEVDDHSNSIILNPQEAVYIKPQHSTLEKYTHQNTTSTWREGYSMFRETSLDFVLDEVERRFNIEIERPSELESRIYTGVFYHKDLEEALKTICLPMGLEYSIDHQNKKVSIN